MRMDMIDIITLSMHIDIITQRTRIDHHTEHAYIDIIKLSTRIYIITQRTRIDITTLSMRLSISSH
jgi:hypothetical protein